MFSSFQSCFLASFRLVVALTVRSPLCVPKSNVLVIALPCSQNGSSWESPWPILINISEMFFYWHSEWKSHKIVGRFSSCNLFSLVCPNWNQVATRRVTLMWTRARAPSLLPSLLMRNRNQTTTSQSRRQMEPARYWPRLVEDEGGGACQRRIWAVHPAPWGSPTRSYPVAVVNTHAHPELVFRERKLTANPNLGFAYN